MYINVFFAVAGLVGATMFMATERSDLRTRIDLAGGLLASAGLFALVFGFSHAESAGWTSGVTVASLVLGVVLLNAFAVVEQRIRVPLLPPRVVSERFRAAAFGAVSISSFAMFGLFLFLTYYLQTVQGISPVWSGLAFLPMVGCIIVSANVSNTITLPRFGPRVVITTGMTVGCLSLAYLSRLDVHSSYAGGVLPSLLGMGLAMGMIVAPAMSTATTGVEAQDAAVASALVNTMQQVGGSVGTAVLSTLVASATTSYATGHRFLGDGLAATHGYTVAFAISAGAFAAGAVLGALLFPSKQQLDRIRETPDLDPGATAQGRTGAETVAA